MKLVAPLFPSVHLSARTELECVKCTPFDFDKKNPAGLPAWYGSSRFIVERCSTDVALLLERLDLDETAVPVPLEVITDKHEISGFSFGRENREDPIPVGARHNGAKRHRDVLRTHRRNGGG